MTTQLVKRSGESRVYTADFSQQPELRAGDVLSAVLSVVFNVEEPEGATSDLTVGTPSLDATNKKVQVPVAGGTDGRRYRQVTTARTLSGAVLQCVGYLLVDDRS